jgi:hypothetical protein
MYHFLKVIEQAQDYKEKIHHTFKSGRKTLLFQCEENCENCGEPTTCHYWGSQDTDPHQQEADMAFDRCRRCAIGDTTRFGGEKYFIIFAVKRSSLLSIGMHKRNSSDTGSLSSSPHMGTSLLLSPPP